VPGITKWPRAYAVKASALGRRVKFKATTNSNHGLPVAENLLNQDFTAQRRDEKWVSDINLRVD